MLLKFFNAYVSKGLRPIAVYPNTKQPIGKGWNKDWSVDRWRGHFELGNCNIGLLLGDVVDVEGDNEEANNLLDRMIGGVPHPMFHSKKSVHHLFLNPDQNLTHFSCNNIEFRAHLHQSVVPPSVHEDGVNYQFLKSSRWPVPPMPEELFSYYCQQRNYKPRSDAKPRSDTKPGHTKQCCQICKQIRFIHRKRLALELRAFQEFNLPWMCHQCREMDLRNACRRLRKTPDCVAILLGT